MTLRLSRSVPINLYHNYKSIPFSLEDACQSCLAPYDQDAFRCSDAAYALIESLFAQDNNGTGVMMSDVIDGALSLCPSFSETDLVTAFRQALKDGLFLGLAPLQVDYFYGSNPPTSYIIHPEIDKYSKNSPYVKFILSLVGGYRGATFVRWFTQKPYVVNNTTCTLVCQ